MKSVGLGLILGMTTLAAQESQIASGSGNAPELKITKLERGTTEVSEKSVIQSGLVGSGQRANGIRAYAFVLQPGEELKVTMTSEDSALVLQFLFPNVPNAMTPAVRAANQPPKAVRQGRIQIKNPTQEVQEAVLLVGGAVNHAFTLKPTYSRP